eukprot:jgi/Galph1/181/GphlegSOOS_G4922.1
MSAGSQQSTTVHTIRATKKQDSTIILLHGFGSSGKDLAPLAEGILPQSTKCILPDASVLQDGPFPVRAWFSLDLENLSWNGCSDQEGLNESIGRVFELVENEIKNGIPSNRIVVGGFSQGGAVTLNCLLRAQCPLGGFIALSSWLAGNDQYPSKLKQHNLSTPLFMGHGEEDTVVPFAAGKMSRELLQSFGVENITFRSYRGMDHFVNDMERQDIAEFIHNIFKGC